MLKRTISKSMVNGRPIFGKVQADRLRYASFVATTNNPHPLQDVTGSRRYICLEVPKGQQIDNVGDIDYQQLYAQVLYEIRQKNAPYWFNNEEVARIQELNLDFRQQTDIADMIRICFRKPEKGESAKAINCTDILKMIRKDYPNVPSTSSTKVRVGFNMKELGFESYVHAHVTYYYAVPLKTA